MLRLTGHMSQIRDAYDDIASSVNDVVKNDRHLNVSSEAKLIAVKQKLRDSFEEARTHMDNIRGYFQDALVGLQVKEDYKLSRRLEDIELSATRLAAAVEAGDVKLEERRSEFLKLVR